MSKCADHWCEYYGKDSEKCDHCAEKEIVKDNPALRVILKRRAEKLMELDKKPRKNKGQSR